MRASCSLLLHRKPAIGLRLRFSGPSYVSSRSIQTSQKKPHPGRRIAIASEKLCDHILQRLAPTFRKDVSYDIVDLCPVDTVFSAKIHDFLNPRTHVLVDPDKHLAGDALDGLVKRSPASFKYRSSHPSKQSTWDSLFEERILERPDNLSEKDPLNRNLLVFWNAASYTRATSHTRSDVFQTYFNSCIRRNWFHQYGLIRLICTVRTNDTHMILPRNLNERRKLGVLAEGTAKVTQVAGTHNPQTLWDIKGTKLFKKSARHTSERAKEAGLETPKGRSTVPLELAPAASVTKFQAKTRMNRVYYPRFRRPWHDHYMQLRAESKAGRLDAKGKRQHVLFRAKLVGDNKFAARCLALRRKATQIDRLNDMLRRMKANGDDQASEAKRIVSLIAKTQEERNQLLVKRTRPETIHAQVQEERAFENRLEEKHHPLLLWDRRPYEPLHVTPDEFSPHVPCSVLDIQPDPNAPILHAQREAREQGKEEEYSRVINTFLDISRMLVTSRRRPIDETLRLLFPGRSMGELVSACPSLARLARVSVSFELRSGPETDSASQTPQEKALFYYADDCLSEISWSITPASTIYEIAAEWEKWPLKQISYMDLHKILGGVRISEQDDSFDDD